MKHASLDIAITALFLPLHTEPLRAEQSRRLCFQLSRALRTHLLWELGRAGLPLPLRGPVTHVGTAQSLASWTSVLLGAEAAITKHTSLYVGGGGPTAGNTGDPISFTKVGTHIRCFPVMVWLNS